MFINKKLSLNYYGIINSSNKLLIKRYKLSVNIITNPSWIQCALFYNCKLN